MPSIDERVAELMERIRAGAIPARTRRPSDLNEECVEEFIRLLEAPPRRDRVRILRQPLPWWCRRTTRMNYVFHVAGRKPDVLMLVAHYDTWGGPGADDNTTGEEILKQYLLADLDAPDPPACARAYFLAGSEECGLIGFVSQLLVAGLLWAASIALTTGSYAAMAVALALAPTLMYRFGVAGSRYYARSLPRDELAKIRAVIAVDSVGEGKIYIPATTLGADFLRALVPYAGADPLDDLLKEIAHLRHIPYNTHLAGGTTDHLSFLEINRSIPRVCLEGVRRMLCALARRPYVPPPTIPASALVAMGPGKASPFVLGGKIHTPKDTADRIDPRPLRETLAILDDFFERFDRGSRPAKPRRVDECHYARVFELSDGRTVAALKDAVEPNRRNVNMLCAGRLDEAAQTFDVQEVLDWGNEVALVDEMAEYARARGLRFRARRVARLTVRDGGSAAVFEPRGGRPLARAASWLVGRAQTLLGRYSFLAMFATAYLVAVLFNFLVVDGLLAWRVTRDFCIDHVALVLVGSLVLQLLVLIRLYSKHFPTWMDNAYKNLNRADNLGSLRRAPGDPPCDPGV